MLKQLKALFTFMILVAFMPAVYSDMEEVVPVRASLVSEMETIEPESPFWIAINIELGNGWHAYWKNPGDAGMPPTVEWELPEGFSVGEMLWPHPERLTLNESTGYGYHNKLVLLAKITPPKKIASRVELAAEVRWVVCDDASCLPGGARLQTTVSKASQTGRRNQEHTNFFSKAHSQIPKLYPSAEAKNENGFITLILESGEEVSEVDFFPEFPDQIDHTVKPYLIKTNGEKNQLKLHLKEAEERDPACPLKGVVLLKTSQGGNSSFLAYEIDTLLPVGKDNLLTYNSEADGRENDLNSIPQDYTGGFFLALVLAFFGGLLLNLMPCVLPVISFKVLSFVKMAGESRSLIFKHGLAFSFGVLLSFWLLAGILLAMSSWGHAVGWGFQLQEPWFVAALASVILLFSLSMFGLFEVGTGLAGKAGDAGSRAKSTGLIGSFFSGVLATAVATPCTGPFLGTAVGFAVTLPPVLALLIFSSLGVGMASPYLLLAAFPGLLQFMPKPGNWMVTFKEITGFVMLATVLWLLWVFGAETSTLAIVLLLTAFFFMAIGCWILGKWGAPVNKKATRWIGYYTSLSFLLVGGYFAFVASTLPADPSADDRGALAMEEGGKTAAPIWETFSPERVEELRRQGVPVFIDFTAKWCLICQANHLVLSLGEVERKFDELGVVRMKADWTKSSSVITKELKKYGRNSVPLYLLYGKNSEAPAEILPQVLTQDIVIDYLNKVNLL